MKKHNKTKLWIITEGMAGTQNQCLAVAGCLDNCDVSVKRISIKFPFNFLCPFIFKTAPKWAIKGIDWNETPPDIIIASGRKSIAPTLNFNNSFTVFIQDPRIAPSYFDLVAVPKHDKTRGDNVIVTTAAPNMITKKLLNMAKDAFDYSYLPNKKIALLIGGNSKTHTMPDNFAYALMEKLLPYLQSDEYGFLITTSRRTPSTIKNSIKEIFLTSNCCYWDGTGENPYHSFLAHANHILVTEDSTSMISDALTTGKPTYRLELDGGSKKFNHLYDTLKKQTDLRIFEGDLDDWEYEPLNDAKLVADEIKKHFGKQQEEK